MATAKGEQAIGTLPVGDQVTAYEPQTAQTNTQPIMHVWINPDSDLVDVTLRSNISASQPGAATSDAKFRAAELKAHSLRTPPAEQAHPQTDTPTAVPADLHVGTQADDTLQFAAGGKRVTVTNLTTATVQANGRTLPCCSG